MTPLQQQTFMFIKYFINKNNFSPSISEIMAGVGSKSRSLIQNHIQALEEVGLIEIQSRRHRNITVCNANPSNAEASQGLQIPFLGKIAAGVPSEAIGEQHYVDLSKWLLGPNRYLVRVSGNSMLGDHICDGDFALCERRHNIRKDDIAVILLDQSEVTLKRICNNEDQTVTLIPSNPHYSPMVYARDRIDIQGIFLHLLRVSSV